MLKHNSEYRRLKVDGYGLLGSASYWVSCDHLLVVSTSNYVENYQRFVYADIQALFIRRNSWRLIWGAIFSFLTLSLLLGAWVVKADSGPGGLSSEGIFGFAALLGLALVFAALQTINLLRGPTCACHLRTAVQTLALPHLTRWRKADLLIAELTPLALASQAPATPEPAPAATANESRPAEPTTTSSVEPTAEIPQDPNVPPRMI